jgi:hypothetical protein
MGTGVEGRYGLQPVHKQSEIMRPSGPEVLFRLVLRNSMPQGLKATSMTTFYAGDKSPAYPKRVFP